MARSPQTLSVEDRRLAASWAADCAEGVCTVFEAAVPGDTRVREAIEQTRAFATGTLEPGEAVVRRGGDAGAAAREAPTPEARAAAYAAEQAAAVAHMGAHALGAAGYAAAAAALAADAGATTPMPGEGGDGADGPPGAGAHGDGAHGDDALSAAVQRQLATLGDEVAGVLASLPALGEDRAGPLAPGRLSSGRVGHAIRLIQSQLRQG